MAEEDDAAQSLEVNFRRVVVNPEQPPKKVTKFFLTAAGSDIQLDAGYVDLSDLREAIKRHDAGHPQSEPVSFFITDRFMLSFDAARDLAHVAMLVMQHLQKLGVVEEVAGEMGEDAKDSDR